MQMEINNQLRARNISDLIEVEYLRGGTLATVAEMGKSKHKQNILTNVYCSRE